MPVAFLCVLAVLPIVVHLVVLTCHTVINANTSISSIRLYAPSDRFTLNSR
ncbi:hypothetical protein [Pseudomonas mosselii]|uniref:hypothetical protein n=1 Tax=Pseudomonas mosselii TaxID=78327 RepID=UPI003D768BDA